MLEDGEKDLHESICMLKNRNRNKGKERNHCKECFICRIFIELSYGTQPWKKVTGQAGATTPTQGFISEPEQLMGTLTGSRVGKEGQLRLKK